MKVTKLFNSRTVWKDWPEKVKALYTKLSRLSHDFLSTTEHVKFRWNSQGPTCKAKYFYQPIVN